MANKKNRSRRSTSGRSGNPARAAAGPSSRPLGPRPQRAPSGPSTDSRRALERWSAPVLLFVSRLPRLLVPLLLAVILVAGLLVPNGVVGGLLLLVIVAFLSWLVALSWPVLAPSARAIRVLTILALLGLAVFRFLGRI